MGNYSLGGMKVAVKRWRRLLLLLFLGALVSINTHAGFDLYHTIPEGSRILQVVTDIGFDNDAGEELLVLTETAGLWKVFLLNVTVNGYEALFSQDVGRANYFYPKGQSQHYSVLHSGDINSDGVADFWLTYYSVDHGLGCIQLLCSSKTGFHKAAEVYADYAVQLANYQGEWVIHEINKDPFEDIVKLRSYFLKKDKFELEEQEYQLTLGDYQRFAERRWRPRLFRGRNSSKHLQPDWCRSFVQFAQIPHGRNALINILPEKAYLLDFIPDQALDLDTDIEYLLAYLLPDPEDPRQVRLHAGVADWVKEERKYALKSLPGSFYGLARHGEGDFYQPIYLLRGNGLSHPMIVGNAAPDKPLIELKLFANDGMEIKLAKSLQAGFYLQFIEHAGMDGFYYRAVTAGMAKDGRVQVAGYKSIPESFLGACVDFEQEKDALMSLSDFKREFYTSEETDWIIGGYESPILKTNYSRLDPFMGELPDPQRYNGDVESYLARYVSALKVRSWWTEDFNDDGNAEVLSLFKTNHRDWPPVYRLGYLRFNGAKAEIYPVGPYVQPDELSPAAGAYLYDIDGDKVRELVFLNRGTNPETQRPGVNLELYRFVNGSWARSYAKDIWYDDLRLLAGPEGLELSGFVLNAARKPQGIVYEFIWKNNGFHLAKKVSVVSYDVYLRRMDPGKTSILTAGGSATYLR
jgi:hypothetical protein